MYGCIEVGVGISYRQKWINDGTTGDGSTSTPYLVGKPQQKCQKFIFNKSYWLNIILNNVNFVNQ